MIRKILVVDDEMEFGKSVQRFLDFEGFTVDFAINGKQGFYKIKNAVIDNNQYELLITDLIMPHLDGYELIKKVQASFPQISIIAISGFVNLKDIEELLRPGIDGFSEKPFNPDDLRALIRQLSDIREKDIIKPYI